MRTRHTTLAAGLLAILAVAAPSQAQQFTAATPFHTLHDSFFENQSITWAGNYRGVNFSFGSAALSTPQFGTPNNSAGLTTNFGYFNKYGQIAFGLNFGQGSNQTSVTQTPSVTLMNGQQAFVSDTSQTPFVISVIPVVGDFAAAQQPVIVVLSEGTFMTVQAVVTWMSPASGSRRSWASTPRCGPIHRAAAWSSSSRATAGNSSAAA